MPSVLIAIIFYAIDGDFAGYHTELQHAALVLANLIMFLQGEAGCLFEQDFLVLRAALMQCSRELYLQATVKSRLVDEPVVDRQVVDPRCNDGDFYALAAHVAVRAELVMPATSVAPVINQQVLLGVPANGIIAYLQFL